MKIFLSPEVEQMIAEKVNSGRYRSADEVVREGLELLQEHENHGRGTSSDQRSGIAAMFGDIAKGVPETDWANVHTDLSKNVDHYLYGRRKSS